MPDADQPADVRQSALSQALERKLRAFVNANVAGDIIRFDRPAVGTSRLTILVDVRTETGEVEELVIRHDSGDGPLSGTDITLENEAKFYVALEDQPVRMPRLRGISADNETLLMNRILGSADITAISGGELASVEADFGAAMAELHNVDVAQLALDHCPLPGNAVEHATIEIDRWISFYEDNVGDRTDWIDFTADWLRAHPPDAVERTVLCHGDAGAGNFLYRDGLVTAILDWEFAHVGDVFDDLAWVLVRDHIFKGSASPIFLRSWSDITGIALSSDHAAKAAYYRAFVMLRMAIACKIALALSFRDTTMETAVYETLLPLLNFYMPHMLREAGCRNPSLDEWLAAAMASPIAAERPKLQSWNELMAEMV